jgi:periplasmic copper chaperone A
MIRFLAAVFIALGLGACAPSGPIAVKDAVITVHGEVGAGYFTLDNGGPGDTLIAVSSPAAKTIEMHVSEMKDGMMTMRRLEKVEALAGGHVDFAPGGRHLMLFGAASTLAEGQSIPVTLTFEKAGAKQFAFTVKTSAVGTMH